MAAYSAGWERSYVQADLALLHYYRGAAAYKLEQWIESAKHLKSAYDLLDYVESSVDACWIVLAYGLRQGRMGEPRIAATTIAHAYVTYSPAGVQRGYLLWGWGWNAFHAGDHDHGLNLMLRALSSFEVVGADVDATCAALDIAECFITAGRAEHAADLLARFEVNVATRTVKLQARFENLCAECALAGGRLDSATSHAVSAHAKSKAIGDHRQYATASDLLLRIAAQVGGPVALLAESAVDASVCARDCNRLQFAMSMRSVGRELPE
jgi:hypothetical protein